MKTDLTTNPRTPLANALAKQLDKLEVLSVRVEEYDELGPDCVCCRYDQLLSDLSRLVDAIGALELAHG